MNRLLIIFAKNPELGKVKTRLAKSIGDEAALAVYQKLLAHVQFITHDLNCDKAVYYTNFIDKEDNWDNSTYKKYLQSDGDLGDRMFNAINDQLIAYDQVVLIGTDIYDLTSKHIENAFELLLKCDVVIGPAEDGGYYLIGMNAPHKSVFDLKEWSTAHVFSDTLSRINSLNLDHLTIETLNDIDELSDLKRTDLLSK